MENYPAEESSKLVFDINLEGFRDRLESKVEEDEHPSKAVKAAHDKIKARYTCKYLGMVPNELAIFNPHMELMA